MATDSSEYEQFIAKLINDIEATHRDIHFLCSGAKCRLMGGLGQKHQIDVAFEDRTFNPTKLVLIECKLNNPKYHVGPDVIKMLAFNGCDLAKNTKYPNDYLLIVCSTSAFTSGAKKLANALGMKLERVSFASDYTFRYENIILAAFGDGVRLGDDVSCTVHHADGTVD